MSDQLAEALEMWDSDIANGLLPDPVMEAPILDAARVHLSCNTVTEAEVKVYYCDTHFCFDKTKGFAEEPKCWKRYMNAPGECLLVEGRWVREGNQ